MKAAGAGRLPDSEPQAGVGRPGTPARASIRSLTEPRPAPGRARTLTRNCRRLPEASFRGFEQPVPPTRLAGPPRQIRRRLAGTPPPFLTVTFSLAWRPGGRWVSSA